MVGVNEETQISLKIGELMMYDLDHALNGKLRNDQAHQIRRQVQHEHFAQSIKTARGGHRTRSLIRTVLISFINLLIR